MKSCNLNARETLSLVPVLHLRYDVTKMPASSTAKGCMLHRYSSFALRELASLKIRTPGLTLGNVMNYASALPTIPGTDAENVLDLDNSMLLLVDFMGEKFKGKDPVPSNVDCHAYVIDGHTAPTSTGDWTAVVKSLYAKDFTDNLAVVIHGVSTSQAIPANRQTGFIVDENVIPLFLEVAASSSHSTIVLHVAENEEALAALVNEKNAPTEPVTDSTESVAEPEEVPTDKTEDGAAE